MTQILSLGDPRLRQQSLPVEAGDPSLPGLLDNLASALQGFRSAHGWGRAVAMPQLGVAKRIIVFNLGSGPFFAINPVIEWASEEMFEVWDDCMCLPEIAVRVKRHRSITLSYRDERMMPKRMERVPEDVSELVQHEVDHLNGIVLTDRMLPEWGVVSRALRAQAQPIAPNLGTATRKAATP
jgi:peptide deformylase